MKKKILIVSLAVNMLAGAFVFYSFTSKEKSGNDGGGYIVMRVSENLPELSISDGNSILGQEDLSTAASKEKIMSNNQKIAKKINDLKNQGYELISSTGGDLNSRYIFIKK